MTEQERSAFLMRAAGVRELTAQPALPAPGSRFRQSEAAAVPLWRKAVNFARAIGAHLWAGWRNRPSAAQRAAVSVCERGTGLPDSQVLEGHCDHYRPSDGTCGGSGGCGCRTRFKVRWLEQRCPLDRWPKP